MRTKYMFIALVLAASSLSPLRGASAKLKETCLTAVLVLNTARQNQSSRLATEADFGLKPKRKKKKEWLNAKKRETPKKRKQLKNLHLPHKKH